MANRKLLIVDDEVDLVVVLVRMARDHGYDASGTIDPGDVMQIVRASRPDVVLLDLHMPRIDGRDLIARIVAEPTSPAVIVMSGWIDELTRELCRAYGAVDIVRKPFEIDDLFRRIDAAARTART
jgi:DNA-binding response OmpR family regulator